MAPNKEKLLKLMGILGDHLAEHIIQNSPVKIGFQTYAVRFQIENSENMGLMKLSYQHPGQLRLQLGVVRVGTDRLYSNFFPCKNEEEMLRYLKDSAAHAEWAQQTIHLSESVNDYWD